MKLFSSDYFNLYKTGVTSRLPAVLDTAVIRESDVSHLPLPVKRYLHYTGAVGKPKVLNARAVFGGSMKQKPGGGWMDIRSQQYNFFDDPARFFYIRSGMFGLPFDGLHEYNGDHAVMQIKVANLFTVADARGDEMDQGETVTMFNDMCLLAPATLIDRNIQWKEVSENQAEAIFTNRKHTIAAKLFFDSEGALVDFISHDRFLSSDGKTYLNFPWSTPVKNYTELNGRKIPSYGEAIWHMPEGPFTYARFNIKEIGYNLSEFK